MTKEVFSDLATLVNGVSAINGIVTEIEVAFDNTLSRDGSSPNQMAASLDMNSNRILNLPLPLANTEPARLIDIFNYLSFPDTGDRESLTFKKEGAPANQVYWRLSTGGNGEPGLDLLNDALSATPALTISRSGSSPTNFSIFSKLTSTSTMTGSGTGNYAWNSISITDSTFSNPSGNTYGFRINMTGRGATAIGGRFAFGTLCQWDTPGDPASAPATNFGAGAILQGIANYDNTAAGGAVVKPSMYGGNSNVVATALAVNWGAITCHEFDVTTYAGSTYQSRTGSEYVLTGTGPVGTVRDAAIVFKSIAGVTNRWSRLLSFDNLSGGSALADTGAILKSQGSMTIGDGIDVSSCTITGNFLKGPSDNFHVTGAGDLLATSLSSNSTVTIVKSTAPADQRFFRWTTDANGQPLLQALSDTLVASTWVQFTRTGGTSAAAVFATPVYIPASATLAGINIAPGTTPSSLANGAFWFETSTAFARLNGTTKQFVFSGDACTWSGVQTFSVAPIFSSLTGYVKANGAAQLTAAATLPSVDFADGNTGTGAVAHAASPAFTGNPTAPTQAPSDNSTKLATTAYADAIAIAAGGTYAKQTVVQVFTANGTYTPTTGMKVATVYAFGGGGGGGSGARNAAGAAAGGGSGGGGGGLAQAWFTAAQIGASKAVAIGAGGGGGAAQTVNATAGNAGTAGTATSLGTLLFAGGGGGGQGGALAANSGGGAAGNNSSSGPSGAAGVGGVGSFNQGNGGSGVAGANSFTMVGSGSGGAGSPAAGTVGLTGGFANPLFSGGSGGGSGGGITTADAASNGGAGGAIYLGGAAQFGAAGTVGAGQAGGAGPTFANSGGPINQAAAGGGGAASNLAATAGTGGTGGLGVGGGGGGVASRDGFNSGAGGNGGAGLMIIVEQF